MFKRIISFMSMFVLLVSISACSTTAGTQNGKGDVISPEARGPKKEINVMVYKTMHDSDLYDTLNKYKTTFERELGVKVNLVVFGNPKYVTVTNGTASQKYLDPSWEDDFFTELSPKLYGKDGPELIVVYDTLSDSLSSRGAVLNVKDKIPNLIKIYPGIIQKETYYVPVGMRYAPFCLNKNILDELNIDKPSLDWTRDDYLKIRGKWFEKEPVRLSAKVGSEVISSMLGKLNIYDSVNNKVTLSTPSVIEGIKDIRNEIYSGKYILNKNYNYLNYFNMFYDATSEEFNEDKQMGLSEDQLQLMSMADGFRANRVTSELASSDKVILPSFSKGGAVTTWGFVVNHNGKNIDLALQFVNGILSDEEQLNVFKSNNIFYYPVNSEIESDIKSLEAQTPLDKNAVELKDYILVLIKKPYEDIHYSAENTEAAKIYSKIDSMIKKDLFKFIFSANPYPDDELAKDLKDLEDKCNIYINE